MIKGYIDAYTVFNEHHFLDVAKKNILFLFDNAFIESNILIHTIGKKQHGFLEDYSFFIETLISLYQTTFEEVYLTKAYELMNYCFQYFLDKESHMFYFTSNKDKALVARKMELSDNVIPASNSSIAKSLLYLGHLLEKPQYIEHSKKMLNNMLAEIENYGSGYSNWSMLYLHFIEPFYEVAIVGKDVDEKKRAFNKYYLPNTIFAGSISESKLPLLKNRYKENETWIYVCTNNTCKAPVKSVEEAIKLMGK